MKPLEKIKNKFSSMDLKKLGINLIISTFFLWMIMFLVKEDLPSWLGDKLFFVLFVASGVFYFVQLIKKVPKKKRDKSSIVYYFSHFFLLPLLVIAINQFLKRAWIIDNLFYISVLAIGFGFLTFYANRDRVEKEIEDEKVSEERAEKKRAKEFDKKFPFWKKFDLKYGIKEAKGLELVVRILVSPFVFLGRLPYRLVRWMYKEGWNFSIPFVGITVLFIAIRIGMPLIFTGSYIDEYNHIMSGIEFFKTGHFAEIYSGSYYTRGAIISFLVGIFFKIFGESIFVAKMVPAMFGIISFFLLFGISRKLKISKNRILLLLFIYSIFSLSIFNHFYIRIFIIYEICLLGLIFLFLKIKNTNFKSKKIYLLFIFTLINIAVYIYSNDAGKYIILIASIILAFNMLPLSIKKRWYFLLPILLFFIDIIYEKIIFLFSVKTQFHSQITYISFFIENYPILLIFFVISFLFFVSRDNKNSNSKIILIASMILLLIHSISSRDIQTIRVITYFMPILVLASVCLLDKVKFNSKKIFTVILVLSTVILLFNIPPQIGGEVNYKDYKIACEKIDSNSIVLTTSPHICEFYVENITTYLIRDNKDSSLYNEKIFCKGKNETLYCPSKSVAITDPDELKDLIESIDYVIIDSDLKSSISSESKKQIEQFFKQENKYNLRRMEIWEKR